MSLAKRIIPCLDVKEGRVVKGIQFVGLRDAGDPVEQAMRYDAERADELCFLDITASHEGRASMLDVIRRTADSIFIPFTVGGGIRSIDDFNAILGAGADKVAVNTAALANPDLIQRAADHFGSQCVVVAVDARRTEAAESGWEVYTHGGRKATGIDAVEWCARAQALGAGEILLTSMDCDGTRDGYDLSLLNAVTAHPRRDVLAVQAGRHGQLADVGRVDALPLPHPARFFQHAKGIGQATEGGWRKDRRIRQREQTLAQRQQVPGQIAAVHRGDVAWRERLQGFGVVPVVEVPAMARQQFHGGQRALGSLHQSTDLQVSEVQRGEVGQQRQSDIGGRSASRHHQGRVLLDIVRRQPVVLGADPGLEEGPGATRQPAQEGELRTRELSELLPRRPAHPGHQRRRCEPQRQDRRGNPQRHGIEPDQQCGDSEGERRREPHAAQLRAEAAAQAALHFAGRIPLQQVAAAHRHAPQRAGDGAQAEGRFVGQAGQVHRGAKQLARAGSQYLHQVRFQRHVHRLGEHVAQRGHQHRQQQQAQHPQGPCQ